MSPVVDASVSHESRRRVEGVGSHGAGVSGRFHGNDERIDVESLALTTQAWLETCELFLG